jgi:hypothetical protein
MIGTVQNKTGRKLRAEGAEVSKFSSGYPLRAPESKFRGHR